MLSEIFMQIYRILTKLCQLKLGGPVIMPDHVYMSSRAGLGAQTPKCGPGSQIFET